jgi:hypothetical protein
MIRHAQKRRSREGGNPILKRNRGGKRQRPASNWGSRLRGNDGYCVLKVVRVHGATFLRLFSRVP